MGLFDFLRRKPRVTLPPPADLDSLLRTMQEMTRFDLLVGRLCSEYFREYHETDRVMYYGMLGVFHEILKQAVAGEIEPEELLEEHAAKSEDASQMVEFAGTIAHQVVGESWDHVAGTMQQQGKPVSVGVVTVLVQVIEKIHRRPHGPALRGHFAVAADFNAAVALHLAVQAPERARFLAAEDV
jgi:hypothetical protein